MPFEFPEQVETLDLVPEEYRSFYKPGEEPDAPAKLVNTDILEITGSVGRLKGALESERNVSSQHKKALSGFRELGEDPEQLKTKMNELTGQIETLTKDKDSINPDKIRQGIAGEYEEKIAALEQQKQNMESFLHQHLVTGEIAKELGERGANQHLLSSIIAGQCKVVEENGKHLVVVFDGDGEIRYKGAAPMTISQLIDEMEQDKHYAPAFPGRESSGGGTPPGRKPARPISDMSNLSSQQKISQGLQRRK